MEYIKLAHAHVNQHTSNGNKTNWKIEANKTNELLGELSNKLDHNEVFEILDFARKYELEAFNIGVDFGKEEYKKAFEKSISDYASKMDLATKENERLSEALELITNNK